VYGRHAEAWNRGRIPARRVHMARRCRRRNSRPTPEDFRVEEQLSFIPSASGPHWLMRVEKRGANTRWVEQAWRARRKCRQNDVGFAGLKDRHAVNRQWSVWPVCSTTADYWSAVHTAEFRVLEFWAIAEN